MASALWEIDPAPAQTVELRAGVRAGLPGQRITVPVDLQIGGVDDFGGLLHSFHLPDSLQVVPVREGSREIQCTVSQSIGSPQIGFQGLPQGCAPEIDCRSIEAFMIGHGFVDGELYRCRVVIAGDAIADTLPVQCTHASSSTDLGEALPTVCLDGEIRVTNRTGDCDGDGVVTIDELVRSVTTLLGESDLDDCPPIDEDLDEAVRVNDVVRAVIAAQE